MTDVPLTDKAQGEALSVFTQFVREHKRVVFALSYAKLRNIHDAEDVTQDVFVEAFRNFRKLKNPEKLRPWLRKVTLCRCNDAMRRTQRREKREFTFMESISNTPVTDESLGDEHCSAVLEAIGGLPEENRVVVMLKYFARLSYADISRTTGLSRATVSNRLQAAKKSLRKFLARANEGVD